MTGRFSAVFKKEGSLSNLTGVPRLADDLHRYDREVLVGEQRHRESRELAVDGVETWC
jgi:hypothetical protein